MRPDQPLWQKGSTISQILSALQCVAIAVLLFTSASLDDALSKWQWQLNLAVVAVLWGVLRRRTRRIADRASSHLDERELATRNRVAWWGYTAAVSGGTTTALVLVSAARMHYVDAEVLLERTGTSLISLMLLAAVAPTTILAATTPANETDE